MLIQARSSSTRLPNKVLYEINGKPLLQYIYSRLILLKRNPICVATSVEAKDDKIEEFCKNNNIQCYRGFLENVAKRMLDAAKYYNADAFVRINGDSPLLDPQIVEKGISIYKNGNYDLVTNSFPRSFPVGQSVEVIRTSTFEKAYEKMSRPGHYEHVTKYYYDHPDEFRIKNFCNANDLSSYRLVVDTPDDLNRMKKIIGSMTRPHTEYSLDELIELYPCA